MDKRFEVVIIDRNAMSENQRLHVEDALNDPARRHQGLEGIYATEAHTIIVWRVST